MTGPGYSRQLASSFVHVANHGHKCVHVHVLVHQTTPTGAPGRQGADEFAALHEAQQAHAARVS
eukprot:scaffold15963_cov36-Phaeocystis_antarctica.AAC.1